MSGPASLTEGLRAARLAVALFLVVDVASTFIAQGFGETEWGRTGPLPVVQNCLGLAAAIAALWDRRTLAIMVAIPLGLLALVVAPSGTELILLIIIAGTTALRARPRAILLTLAAMVAYSVAFGARIGRLHPGEGFAEGAIDLTLVACATALGLGVRALLAARDRRHRELDRAAAAIPQIRAKERALLASELQTLMNNELFALERQSSASAAAATEESASRLSDAAHLRRRLDDVDARSRALLEQLRALLGVLRQESVIRGSEPGASEGRGATQNTRRRAERFMERLSARHVRWAFTALFGLLALRAAVDLARSPDLAEVVIVLGWIACALACSSTRLGLIVGGLSLGIMLLPNGQTLWYTVPAAVVVLLTGIRAEPRRVPAVAAGIVAYTAVVALTGAPHNPPYWSVMPIVGVLALTIAILLRHLHAAHILAQRRAAALSQARLELAAQERSAVARDLHDVVARQLSLTTMQIMATSHSSDPETLGNTLAAVATNAAAAREELHALVSAMDNADESDLPEPSQPLTSAHHLAEQLANDLTHHQFRPEFTISPEVAHLDTPTQRTVGRVLQEATTNILRYAPPGAACRFGVNTDGELVRIRIASSLAHTPRGNSMSLGWGLLGVRERIDLLGGSFSAGPHEGAWLVQAELPLSRSAV